MVLGAALAAQQPTSQPIPPEPFDAKVVGRAIGPDGKPLRRARLRVCIEATGEDCIYEDPKEIIRTDRNGTFSYVFAECETPPKLMSLRLI